ncbi:MAG: ABC transporter ATP-binding protein [Acidimicrobiales bacterium]|nr:MAG: ABC transporter ATP-binding protein [Acidimicrobiales bacterium]
MNALSMSGVVKRYGSTVAVAGLDLDVAAGSLLGLIGPNGAGKSTTLAMAATLTRATEGSIEVLGVDAIAEPREVRRRVGFMPDQMGFYDDMTVDDYLLFFADAHEIPRKERPALIDNLLELVELGPLRERPVAALSRGQSQRLGIGRVLVHDPELLLLDEPASGLDPVARADLLDLLRQLRDLGKTIVISTHILSELEPICTEVAVMAAGRVVAIGAPDELRTEPDPTRTIQVRFADGTGETFTVVDDEEQEALLRRLVADDSRPVLEFERTHRGLAALFEREVAE